MPPACDLANFAFHRLGHGFAADSYSSCLTMIYNRSAPSPPAISSSHPTFPPSKVLPRNLQTLLSCYLTLSCGHFAAGPIFTFPFHDCLQIFYRPSHLPVSHYFPSETFVLVRCTHQPLQTPRTHSIPMPCGSYPSTPCWPPSPAHTSPTAPFPTTPLPRTPQTQAAHPRRQQTPPYQT